MNKESIRVEFCEKAVWISARTAASPSAGDADSVDLETSTETSMLTGATTCIRRDSAV
jgi:hypothetical protein